MNPENAPLLKSRTKHRQMAEQIAADVARLLANGGTINHCETKPEPDRMVNMTEFADMLGISVQKLRTGLAAQSIIRPHLSAGKRHQWRHAAELKFAAIYQASKRATRHE